MLKPQPSRLVLPVLVFVGAFSMQADASQGVIHFRGAIVESNPCSATLPAHGRKVRIECEADNARAGGLPENASRLGAKQVRASVTKIVIPPAGAEKRAQTGYLITLSYL
ncbi:hypothetical protein [Achromobacter sp. KK8]|jgi:hypothetical protein